VKRIFQYLKPYRFFAIASIVLLIAQGAIELILPSMNADIINKGVQLNDAGYVVQQGITMLLASLLMMVVAISCSACASYTAARFSEDLRHDVFKKVGRFSNVEMGKFGAPGLITRTSNDITQIQNLVYMLLRMTMFAPIMLVGGVVMALRQDTGLSIILAVAVPVIVIIIGIMLVKTMPLFQSLQVKLDKLNQIMREKLSGVRVIRAFVRDGYERERFDKANRDLTDTQLRAMKIITALNPAMTLIMTLGVTAAYWFGAQRVDAGFIEVGDITAFMTYIMHVVMSVMIASMNFIMLPRAMVSMDRISEVLDSDVAIEDPAEPRSIPEGFDSLEFRDVSFRYPGAEEPVLSHITVSVGRGETLAIIGSTGSGKSTLINLIPRLYDVTEGAVLLNGVDVRSVSQRDLRFRLGFVPQRAFLFEGTVASNLRYAKDDATEEEMWHALTVAQGKDFVLEKEAGLDSEISQGGANLSGGQRQRMAIARALVRRPDVYIFDDSFSALDFKTDAMLREALKSETRGAAVIIVAQRVSTIMHADRILVLENGKAAGIGTHQELMRDCSVYREIVLSQLSEEEVAQ